MATAKPVQSAHTRDTNEKLANLDNTTKETVQRIDKVNNKITDLREQRMRDPDTLGDKAFKLAFPALIGMVAGKAFQSVWNLVTNKVHPSPNDDEARQTGPAHERAVRRRIRCVQHSRDHVFRQAHAVDRGQTAAQAQIARLRMRHMRSDMTDVAPID